MRDGRTDGQFIVLFVSDQSGRSGVYLWLVLDTDLKILSLLLIDDTFDRGRTCNHNI